MKPIVTILYAAVDCGPPPGITYGDVSLVNQNTKFGAAAIYKCASGYSLLGESESICLANGKWSGQLPSCIGELWIESSLYAIVYTVRTFTYHESINTVVDCGALDPPLDGSVELTGTGVGDKAYYSCNTGFTLEGKERRVCQENGEWSDTAPSCAGENHSKATCMLPHDVKIITGIRCKHLPSPPNGLVHITTKTVGSQATYECFTGYILEGVRYRTCHPGGYWSGEEPVCKGMYIHSSWTNEALYDKWHHSTAVICELLTSPLNGAVSTTGRDFGSKARYRCQPGYTLQGDKTRECHEDGYWSGHSPTCVCKYIISSCSINLHDLMLFLCYTYSQWLQLLRKSQIWICNHLWQGCRLYCYLQLWG